MPFEVVKDENACSASEPWAVKNKDTGDLKGCHSSESKAKDQQKALYANTENAAAQAAVMAAIAERNHLGGVMASAPEPIEFPAPIITYEKDGVVLCRMNEVRLMEAGMNWPGMYGEVTFGDNHLSSAVAAAADPMIPRPRIGLGHTDPRYNPHPCPSCGFVIPPDMVDLDGDPNFGFVENMTLGDEGVSLSADIVDIPAWLAAVLPVAYPSRSIEGWFAHMGPNKKEYDFIMTRMALLGVHFPGFLVLPDLPSFYGADKPEEVEVVSA